MESLRERAIAAYQKQQALMPHYKSLQVENWIAEEFGIECGPVVWEKQWRGEIDLGEVYLWVNVHQNGVDALLSQRCEMCGHVDAGSILVRDLASLGMALLLEREFCSQCRAPYARD